MNKYLWMAHQLRRFNDVGSIINWSNAMLLVKGLLFDPLPAAPTPVNTTSSTVSLQHTKHHLSINEPHVSSTNIPPVPLSTLSTRSITPPTTICFKPTIKTMPLTKFPLCCFDYSPRKPSPLTTYTHCQHAISPSDCLPRCLKRRKLAIPPTVDYHASPHVLQHTPTTDATSSSQPASTATTASQPETIPGQGKVIWYIHNPKDPAFHLWSKIKQKGAKGYLVIQTPPDWNSPFRLKNVATGECCDLMFTKKNEHLFCT